MEMKKIRINTGKVGLVFKNGDYQKMLSKGTYWLGIKQTVIQYDLTTAFHPPRPLDLLLQDEVLAENLEIIEIKDNELALLYEHNNFKTVLYPGRHAYWKGIITRKIDIIDLSEITIEKHIAPHLYAHPSLYKHIRRYEVSPHEKGLLMIDDNYVETVESGSYVYWKNDTKIELLKADLRQKQLEISGQELLTKDKAGIRVNFQLQYQITNMHVALLNHKDFEKQLYIYAQLALREFIGQLTLDELLERKEKLGESILTEIKEKSNSLGVKVSNCGIRDIILPGDMKAIMNQVLIAQKQAQANTIMRREETASTRSLLNTAKLMEENAMLFKLKEMEYVEKIADKIGEITVTGNDGIVTQLNQLFAGKKNSE